MWGGDIVQKLNERINGHKTDLRNFSKHRHCPILCKQLTSGMSSGARYQIQITEIFLRL